MIQIAALSLELGDEAWSLAESFAGVEVVVEKEEDGGREAHGRRHRTGDGGVHGYSEVQFRPLGSVVAM